MVVLFDPHNYHILHSNYGCLELATTVDDREIKLFYDSCREPHGFTSGRGRAKSSPGVQTVK